MYAQTVANQGALYCEEEGAKGVEEVASAKAMRKNLFLNLGKGSSIFGGANTVQPDAIQTLIIIKT